MSYILFPDGQIGVIVPPEGRQFYAYARWRYPWRRHSTARPWKANKHRYGR